MEVLSFVQSEQRSQFQSLHSFKRKGSAKAHFQTHFRLRPRTKFDVYVKSNI